jgi:hypothetical protein
MGDVDEAMLFAAAVAVDSKVIATPPWWQCSRRQRRRQMCR